MEWPVRIDFKVPWRDLDGAGHVNNANYFSYFESARAKTLQAMMGVKDPRNFGIILARTECDFISPATMDEVLVVEARPIRVGRTSFALAYEVHERLTGRAVAKGTSIQVMFDYEKQATYEVPEEVRAALTSGIAPASADADATRP